MARRWHDHAAEAGKVYKELPPLKHLLLSPDYAVSMSNTSQLHPAHIWPQVHHIMGSNATWLPNVVSRIDSIDSLYLIVYDWILERMRTDAVYRTRITTEDLQCLERMRKIAKEGSQILNNYAHKNKASIGLDRIKAKVCSGYLAMDFAMLCLPQPAST
eukprot:m.255400 g.255400  ORF g.255400 m.255400 type:complete len:159 (+) comp15500_c0_seq3:654-1130(+)